MKVTDLLNGHSQDLEEHQGLPLGAGKSAQREPNHLLLLERKRRGCSDRGREVEREPPLEPLSPLPTAVGIADDLEQPAAKPIAIAKPRVGFPGPHQRVLQKIVPVGRRARQPAGEAHRIRVDFSQPFFEFHECPNLITGE